MNWLGGCTANALSLQLVVQTKHLQSIRQASSFLNWLGGCTANALSLQLVVQCATMRYVLSFLAMAILLSPPHLMAGAVDHTPSSTFLPPYLDDQGRDADKALKNNNSVAFTSFLTSFAQTPT